MMNKKEIINKIMEEYSKYGLSRIEVQISYVMAVLLRVPKESIYPGMRMTFNEVFGIKDDKPAIEAGVALNKNTINGVKAENPNTSDKDIAEAIEYVGINTLEETLEDFDFSLLHKVKETMIQSTKQFVEENI